MPPPVYIYEGNDVIRDREIFAAKSQNLKWYWTFLIYLALLFLLAPIYFSFEAVSEDEHVSRNIPLAIALGSITLIIALIELIMYWMIRNVQCMTIRGRYFYIVFFTTQFLSAVVFILSMVWSSGLIGTSGLITLNGNDILVTDQKTSDILFGLWVLRKFFTLVFMVLITGRLRYIVNLYVNTKRLRDEDGWKNYYAQLVIFFPAFYIDMLVEIYVSYILEFYNGYTLQYSSSSVIYLYATVVLAGQLYRSRDWRHSILDWGADMRLGIISFIIFLIWCVIVTQEPDTYMFDFLIAGLGQYNLMVYGFDILISQYVYCRQSIAETGDIPVYDDSRTMQLGHASEDEAGDAVRDQGARQGRGNKTANKDWNRRLDELQNRALYQLNVDLSAEQPYTLHTIRTPGDRTLRERQWEIQRHKDDDAEQSAGETSAQLTNASSENTSRTTLGSRESVGGLKDNNSIAKQVDDLKIEQSGIVEQATSITGGSGMTDKSETYTAPSS